MKKEEKLVLILEQSGLMLNEAKSENENDYILEGVFAQFGVKNNNGRIYEEKEYLPHLEYLKEKVTSKSLFGELDHPERFEVALKNVSHLIESLEYNKDKRQIWGKIKILDTDAGRNAKALLKGGVQLSISSRAAGTVNEQSKVNIKKIFTYDLVAEPGFGNAQMNRINESLGITDKNIAIYDMSNLNEDELSDDLKYIISEKNESPNMINENNNNFVTKEQMNRYSEVLKEELESFKEELYSKNSTIESLEETVKNLTGYTEYLKENLENSISYGEYLGESTKKIVNWSENNFAEVSESHTNLVGYAHYLKENVENGISYSEYLKENIDTNVAYAEYLAENLDNNIGYTEYLKEHTENTINYSKYLKENLGNTIHYTDYLAENLDKNIDYTEYVKEHVENNINYTEYVGESLNDGIHGRLNVPSTIKNSTRNLDDRIDAIVESAKKKKAGMLLQESSNPYFSLLNESRQKEFLMLPNEQKTLVLESIVKAKPMSEKQIVEIWESTLSPKDEPSLHEILVSYIPEKIKPVWESLNENQKSVILRQAEMYDLRTPRLMKDFWQTRTALYEHAEVMSLKGDMLNESKSETTKTGLSNDYMAMIKNKLSKMKA